MAEQLPSWEVFVDFIAASEPGKDVLRQLERHVGARSGVDSVVASLTDHGERFTVGATVLLAAVDAGAALNLARAWIEEGYEHAGVATESFHEAVVRPGGVDPRL